jgi:aminoglycoside 3-N-acetyltransferase
MLMLWKERLKDVVALDGELILDKTVTQADIADGLKKLGLKQGDIAFVHSSLRSFGYVEGGAEAVIKAFLDVLGEEGTLVAPIFRSYFWEGPDQAWDRDNSPSLMGKISETIRTWDGSRKSYHAPHPIAVIGHHAEDLTERHNLSDFSFDSPFARLLELDAWIFLIGVDYNRCTMVHLIEERAGVPYRRWIDLSGTVVYNGISQRKTYPFFARYPSISCDFMPLGKRMEDAGLVNIATIGKSLVRCFHSRDMYDYAMRQIRQGPLILVSEDSKFLAQRHIPKHGKILDEKFSEQMPMMKSQNPIAQKLINALGIPQSTQPPSVDMKNRFETSDDMIIEEFRLKGNLSDSIPVIMAIPKGNKKKLPVVICLHGTGESSELLMEQPFFARAGSLVGWAREFARRGFIAVAITQFSHPPRYEPWNWELPKLLPMYGQTAMGWLVSDVIACVDYLCTRHEVDTGKISVGGFSLGGIAAFYSLVVDNRISAGWTFCGGVGSVRHLIREGSTSFHSMYYYVPDLLINDLDHPQLIPAIIPRPLFIYGTTEDTGMPVSGLKAFEASAQSLGAEDKIRIAIEDGQHALNMKAFEMVSDWLLARQCQI